VTTTATGSTASLQITGGNALTKLGWAAMASPATGTNGTDAVFEFDGVQTSVANPGVGQQVTLNGTSGSVTITLGSGLTAGTGKIYTTTTDSTTTLSGLASKLTAIGLSAQAIDDGSGTNPAKLVISAPETGTKHSLTVNTGALSGFTQAFSTLRAAADAQLTMGSLTITRSSNTVSDLVEGVTLQLLKADPTKEVTVTVGRDQDAVVAKVKAFVDGLNSALATVKGHTKAGTIGATGELDTKTPAGVLWGDGGARRLQDRVAAAMWYTTSGTYTSASQLGIELQRDGTYKLDETKLRAALTGDFDATIDFLARDTGAGTEGLMGTVLGVLDDATKVDGLVDSATRTATNQSKDVAGRITAFDVRLTAIEARYRRQFASLETIVGQLKNQSSWLASQIAQLPKTNG